MVSPLPRHAMCLPLVYPNVFAQLATVNALSLDAMLCPDLANEFLANAHAKLQYLCTWLARVSQSLLGGCHLA